MSNPIALVLAVVLILVWAVSGPVLHFSDTWQLTINTTTTIVTFVVGFAIMVSTKRDSLALHTKLDYVLKAKGGDELIREDEKVSKDIEQDRDSI